MNAVVEGKRLENWMRCCSALIQIYVYRHLLRVATSSWSYQVKVGPLGMNATACLGPARSTGAFVDLRDKKTGQPGICAHERTSLLQFGNVFLAGQGLRNGLRRGPNVNANETHRQVRVLIELRGVR